MGKSRKRSVAQDTQIPRPAKAARKAPSSENENPNRLTAVTAVTRRTRTSATLASKSASKPASNRARKSYTELVQSEAQLETQCQKLDKDKMRLDQALKKLKEKDAAREEELATLKKDLNAKGMHCALMHAKLQALGYDPLTLVPFASEQELEAEKTSCERQMEEIATRHSARQHNLSRRLEEVGQIESNLQAIGQALGLATD